MIFIQTRQENTPKNDQALKNQPQIGKNQT